MVNFKKLIKRNERQSKKQSKETKQHQKTTDSDMTQKLELVNKKNKITVINISSSPMEKLNNMQEQMVNVKEMEIKGSVKNKC